jgi:hypothetical protein
MEFAFFSNLLILGRNQLSDNNDCAAAPYEGSGNLTPEG